MPVTRMQARGGPGTAAALRKYTEPPNCFMAFLLVPAFLAGVGITGGTIAGIFAFNVDAQRRRDEENEREREREIGQRREYERELERVHQAQFAAQAEYHRALSVEKERNEQEKKKLQIQQQKMECEAESLKEELHIVKANSVSIDGNPQKIVQVQNACYKAFLDKLPSNLLDFSDPFPPHLRVYQNVVLVGDVSVGKSSLLNAMFDLKLPVGANHTTTKVKNVHQDGNTVFWDTPGQNTKDQLLHNVDSIQILKAMDVIVIMYISDLNTIMDLCDLIHTLKRPTVLVRMKADQVLAAEKRGETPLSDYLTQDRLLADLRGWKVFACSAWDPAGLDNDQVKQLLLHPK
jgi:small GTP-binding protein